MGPRSLFAGVLYILVTFLLVFVIFMQKPTPEMSTRSVVNARRRGLKRVHLNSSTQVASGVWLSMMEPVLVKWEMDKDNADIALHRHLQQRDACCETSLRVGNKGDGGWDVCTSGPFQYTQSCKVYSFGIARDFSFDDGMGDTFGCDVKSFDPTSWSMKKTYRRSKHVMFYDLGIGGHDHTTKKGWKLRTFSSLLSKFGDQKSIIDYVKMDVEGAEWEALPVMLRDGSLRHVKQLAIEIHRIGQQTRAQSVYRLLDALENQGFRKWLVHYNPGGNFKIRNTKLTSSILIEIYLINMNFVKSGSIKGGNLPTVCSGPTLS